jgi:hypothetical protein
MTHKEPFHLEYALAKAKQSNKQMLIPKIYDNPCTKTTKRAKKKPVPQGRDTGGYHE